jgi:hypothetical protein
MMLTEKPDNTVMFVKAPEPPDLTSVGVLIQNARKPESGDVQVRVLAPYRCCHEGKAYVGGDTVTVPADKANHWIKREWVEPVSDKRKK